MKKVSSYKVMTQKILKECENYLGVYRTLQGSTTLELLTIEDFIKGFKKMWSNITPEEFKKIKADSSYNLSSLSYTDAVCSYYRESILDLSGHVRVDLLCNLLAPFLKRENVRKSASSSIEALTKYLKLLEENDSRYVRAMSYRYIRLFICFYLIGDYSDCSVIANFIIQQAFISGGVDNSVREHLQDLLSVRKQVDDLYDKYSGKSNSSISKVAKKVERKIMDSKGGLDIPTNLTESEENSKESSKPEKLNTDSLLYNSYKETEKTEDVVNSSNSFSR